MPALGEIVIRLPEQLTEAPGFFRQAPPSPSAPSQPYRAEEFRALVESFSVTARGYYQTYREESLRAGQSVILMKVPDENLPDVAKVEDDWGKDDVKPLRGRIVPDASSADTLGRFGGWGAIAYVSGDEVVFVTVRDKDGGKYVVVTNSRPTEEEQRVLGFVVERVEEVHNR